MTGQSTSPRKLTAARLAGVPELERAYSDFTDTYDLTDGDNDRPPSSGPHIVRLQQSLLAMGYRLPNGVNGVYDAATRGVVLQLQIDAGHPRPAGHEWEHILGIGGPNTLAHFDMFDPGPTIADPDLPESGIAATAVDFAESPDSPFAGFDAATSPPSLTLGVNTRRRVRALVTPEGGDIRYAAADPSVATVARIDGGIVVGGLAAGRTVVRAFSGTRELAALDVAVRKPRKATVNFFFVKNGGPTPWVTARSHDQANYLTLRLNRVWRRQAAVHFSLGVVRDITLSRAVATPVEESHAGLFRPFAIADELNVFFVTAWQGGSGPVDRTMLFVADVACPDGMAVPHGAGYFLGYSGPAQPSGVMAECADGTDREHVSRALADIVNP